jgi:hypothetical protein
MTTVYCDETPIVPADLREVAEQAMAGVRVLCRYPADCMCAKPRDWSLLEKPLDCDRSTRATSVLTREAFAEALRRIRERPAPLVAMDSWSPMRSVLGYAEDLRRSETEETR